MSADAEARVEALHRGGDANAALALAVQTYGGEIYGFLVARLRSDEAAGDVFAQACEDLCASIASFEWRCSMRTWFYHLARSAAARFIRSPSNRESRKLRLSQVSDIAEQVRSQTQAYLRTEVKDRFTELREELDADDQTLLILRIDRELDWNEVALVMSDTELAPAQLEQASARLRQRFKTLKEQLKQRAIEVGLLPSP